MDTLDTSRSLAEDVLTVGQALSILCPDFHSQIAHRRYFYQSGRLLMNAIVSLSKSKWHVGTGDLTENRITLDRRILDWVVGLDSEINELVEGSDLYEPQVELSQVVLPQGYAASILSQCSSYDYFQTYRQQIGLNKSISYGNSLVILLCGKSGTGKTMTVNAIAHELHKKVLLVDFNSLMNKKDGGGSDLEVDLKGLFRESKMSNTVLFFDECEVIFKSRNMGSERLLNSLLTEIERHEGIVFMATNRPYEIDEAMHRRINMVLEYAAPDYAMRRKIWDNLLGPDRVTQSALGGKVAPADEPAVAEVVAKATKGSKKRDKGAAATGGDALGKFPVAGPLGSKPASSTAVVSNKGIPLAEDVNTSELAVRYELTGGFIKNAVLSAVLTALSRSSTAPLVTQADLIAGCKLQMRGNLTQRSFEDRVPTGRTLAEMFLTPEHRKQVEKIIRHENARSKVFGEWSVDASQAGATAGAAPKVHCEQRASINLFAGTRGSGKGTLSEAIGQELGGKRIKYIHSSDFMGQNIAEITSVFKTLVHDARIMDALIVIDGFEHILDDGGDAGGGGGSSKLQMMLSRVMDILHGFHGCVCLLCHIENPQNMMLQR
jgi:SpoVK/Ycf46/Vps4 family AAA+-type ATPase